MQSQSRNENIAFLKENAGRAFGRFGVKEWTSPTGQKIDKMSDVALAEAVAKIEHYWAIQKTDKER